MSKYPQKSLKDLARQPLRPNVARLDLTALALGEVSWERIAQHTKWGEQNHPDGTGGLTAQFHANIARTDCERAFKDGRGTWRHILNEEVAEALAESDPEKLKTELIQVAAVAVAWVEKLIREENAVSNNREVAPL